MNATDKVDQSGVTVIDSHTVEIAGVRYRRTDLPPEGYEERWAVCSKKFYEIFDNEESALRHAAYAKNHYMVKRSAVRIYVPKEADDE